jgi:hypothetical protein
MRKSFESAMRTVAPAILLLSTAFGACSSTGMKASGKEAGAGGAGDVFVADHMSHTIRKITPAGVVTTFAGKAGSPGCADGPGADARFNSPSGVTVDAAGNLFVAGSAGHTIRKITPAGVVTTLAGSLGPPFGVAVDGAGNVLVADLGSHVVRKITPAGEVSTLVGVASTTHVGTLPGPLPASLAGPCDVAVNPSNGSLCITVPSAVMLASW